MTDATEKRSKHNPYTEEQWEAKLAEAREWARAETRRYGRFRQKDLAGALSVGGGTPARIRAILEAEGTIVRLGERAGWAALGVVKGEVTAADLLRLAERHFDAFAANRERGRRGDVDGRQVSSLTQSQVKDIKTVLRLVAEYAGDGDLTAVGGPWWGWDEADGDWAIVPRVRDWSDERARERATRRGKAWNPESNASSRSKSATSVRLILDLAATHGLLDRDSIDGRDTVVHAPEWQPIVDRWEKLLLQRSGRRSSRKIRMGLRTLARYATKRGYLDPRKADWNRIRESLIHDHQQEILSYDPFWQARWAYNELRDAKEVDGRLWQTYQSGRVSLVGKGDAAKAARTGDFSGWVVEDGRPAAGLVEGPFGLAAWRKWATLSTAGALERAGLPHRARPRPTPAERRSDLRIAQPFKLSVSTLLPRLNMFSLLAGWATRERGMDWTVHTLVDLVDPELVQGFAMDRTAGRKRVITPEGDLASSVAQHVAFALATLASPFLEAQALKNDDRELADRLRKASDELKELGIQCEAESVKDKWAIVEAWRGDSGRSGWHQLGELRDRLIVEAEEQAGGLSLPEQIEAIRSGRFTPSCSWAIAVRDAVMISFLRVIPVRVRALVNLTTNDWESDGRPWEGAIRTRFPRIINKNGRPFRPRLIHPDAVGDPRRERDFRRDLWELYWMETGARDEILTAKVNDDRFVYSSPYVFPALARRGGGHGTRIEDRAEKGFRYGEGSWSNHFSTIVLRYAEELGMNRQTLERLWGATSSHVTRLLFGSHWANVRGALKLASVMLHHKDSRITEARYCAVDESRVDLQGAALPPDPYLSDLGKLYDEEMPEETSAHEVQSLRAELAGLAEQNRKLRDKLASLGS